METTFNEHGQTLIHVLAIHGYKAMIPQLVEVIDMNRKDLVKKKKKKRMRYSLLFAQEFLQAVDAEAFKKKNEFLLIFSGCRFVDGWVLCPFLVAQSVKTATINKQAFLFIGYPHETIFSWGNTQKQIFFVIQENDLQRIPVKKNCVLLKSKIMAAVQFPFAFFF